MAKINFKSVGKTSDTLAAETPDQSTLPVGIMTPLRFGSTGEGIFAMHFDLGDQIQDNLRNLILTNWGERLGQFDFGANLKQLTTEFVSIDNFDAEATLRIKNAVSKWMPYVTLQDFISTTNHTENQKTGIISFTITYGVPMLNISARALEITLYVL